MPRNWEGCSTFLFNTNVKKAVVYLQLITANDTSKTAKIMNGDITSAAFRQCQRASKVISPFIIFAFFDASFAVISCRYKLQFFTFIFAVLLSRFKCRLPEYFGHVICV